MNNTYTIEQSVKVVVKADSEKKALKLAQEKITNKKPNLFVVDVDYDHDLEEDEDGNELGYCESCEGHKVVNEWELCDNCQSEHEENERLAEE